MSKNKFSNNDSSNNENNSSDDDDSVNDLSCNDLSCNDLSNNEISNNAIDNSNNDILNNYSNISKEENNNIINEIIDKNFYYNYLDDDNTENEYEEDFEPEEQSEKYDVNPEKTYIDNLAKIDELLKMIDSLYLLDKTMLELENKRLNKQEDEKKYIKDNEENTNNNNLMDKNKLKNIIDDIDKNTNNLNNNSIFKLNDQSVNMNVPVLLHEAMHVFGLVGIGSGAQFANDNNDNPPNVYTGEKAIQQYRNVLASNNKSTENIQYLPMEDDFGPGTAMAHLEEGEDDDDDYNYVGDEVRIIDGVTYPILRNELMTGFLNSGDNYLTPITVGLFEDLGFGVNYDSQYVVSTGNNFWWIPGNSNLNNSNMSLNSKRPFCNCKVIP